MGLRFAACLASRKASIIAGERFTGGVLDARLETGVDASIISFLESHQVSQIPGNYCWPSGQGVSVCAVEMAFPWQDQGLSAIPVTAGDRIMVEIEADDRPQKLQAAIFEEASDHASDTAMQVEKLPSALKTPLATDLPTGVYNIRITGQWAVGDQAYKFRLKVE